MQNFEFRTKIFIVIEQEPLRMLRMSRSLYTFVWNGCAACLDGYSRSGNFSTLLVRNIVLICSPDGANKIFVHV